MSSDQSISENRSSRRKRPYPLRIIQDPIVLTEALERDVADEYCNTADLSTHDNHVCGKCSEEFYTMAAFIVHKRYCTNEWPVLFRKKMDDTNFEFKFGANSIGDHQFKFGANSADDGQFKLGTQSELKFGSNLVEFGSKLVSDGGANSDVDPNTDRLAESEMGLESSNEMEALDLCLNAIGNPDDCATVSQPSLSPDGVSQIQSALRSLQGQQMVQLQLIKQIYGQLVSTGANSSFLLSNKSNFSSMDISNAQMAINETNDRLSAVICGILSPPNSGENETSPGEERRENSNFQADTIGMSKSNDISAFDALKSQVINSLKEMEQSVAQQIKEQRKADTYLDKLYRHRCHFCGKVMSSESSLQIHIRSHTGERPYACPHCDSRFSTKGNLKVHMDVHRGEFNLQIGQKFTSDNGQTRISSGDEPKLMINSDNEDEIENENRLSVENGEMTVKIRPRSISVPVLEPRNRAWSKIEFRDDTIIEKYFFDTDDESIQRKNRNLSFLTVSDESNRISSSDQNGMVESTTMPIDLRISSAISHAFTKNPISDPSFLSNQYFPSPTFPNLTALYASPIHPIPTSISTMGDNNRSISEMNSPQISSSLFIHPQQADLMKIGGIENGRMNSMGNNGGGDLPAAISPNIDLDDDWESMMEITTTDEAEKIKSLVGDRDTKVTDPNQCLICHRILSCKSALQMHYRTHTGERPFKCKICSRAFTTKGNLKTHMGVHRTKPPFRLFHQCPICHKKFNNGVILQQHIRLHAGHAPDTPLERIESIDPKGTVKPAEPILDFGRPLVSGPQQTQTTHNNVPILSSPVGAPIAATESTLKRPPSNLISPAVTPSASMASFNAGTKTRTPSIDKTVPTSTPQHDTFSAFSPFSAPPLDLLRSQAGAAAAFASWLTRFGQTPFPLIPSFSSATSPIPLATSSTVVTSHGSIGEGLQGSPVSLALPPTNPFAPIILPSPTRPSMFGKPNTTCNICFKTFACNSALEIHYRSHTKERPFKCTVCGRGFSTKGNMKQHLLTHKIRDTPVNEISSSQSSTTHEGRVGSSSRSATSSTNPEQQNQNSISPPSLATVNTMVKTGEDPITPNNPSNGDTGLPPSLKPERPSSLNQAHQQEIVDMTEGGLTPLESIQSMWARTESMASSSVSPGSKRPPVLSKHQCQVCYKHFSSSSALAIHMRTHTGERPFCCPACGRSFTTKGNLKVHMGTHSWQHAQSRRGRRIFDGQQVQLGFGLGDGQNSFSAALMDDGSNASNANSDLDHGNGPSTPSPVSDGQCRDDTASNAGPTRTNDASTPFRSDHSSNLISPTSFQSSLPSTSPILSSPKMTIQNGSISSILSSAASGVPFNFMNSFPMGPTPSMIPPPPDQNGQSGTTDPMRAMLWMWRNVCSVCRHVCNSVSELEDHLKLHLINGDNGKEKLATSIPT